MVVHYLLTPWIGQVLAIGVFTVLAATLMGIRKWGKLLTLGISTAAAVYFIFDYALDTQLIEGQLFSFLFGLFNR